MMQPVMPNLHLDAVIDISKKLDFKSVCNFSEVNRETYANRNKCFFALFKFWHPDVVKYAASKEDPHFCFSLLAQYHPNNCWKIACCVFSRGFFKAKDAFIEEAVPVFLEEFQKEKAEKDKRSREIWRSFPGDFETLIHQALENDNDIDGLDWYGLKVERELCEKKIRALDDSIHALSMPCGEGKLPKLLQQHRSDLNRECNTALLRHKAIPLLTECDKLLTEINQKKVEPTSENCDCLRSLINSSGIACRTYIWGGLNWYAGQREEDDPWAENNFHEHLGKLGHVVKECLDCLIRAEKFGGLPHWMNRIQKSV